MSVDFDDRQRPPELTKVGWRRVVREVAALEDAAATGNTWGPTTDAAIIARLVIDALRKDVKP